MPLLGAIVEVFCHEGRYGLLRLQWGKFPAILRKSDVKRNVIWIQPNTIVKFYNVEKNGGDSKNIHEFARVVLKKQWFQLSHVFYANTPSNIECSSPSYLCSCVLIRELWDVLAGLLSSW